MKPYTATYRFETILGESGWSYEVRYGGRLVFEGWSRGSKRDAEKEVRSGIEARETLRSFAEAN